MANGYWILSQMAPIPRWPEDKTYQKTFQSSDWLLLITWWINYINVDWISLKNICFWDFRDLSYLNSNLTDLVIWITFKKKKKKKVAPRSRYEKYFKIWMESYQNWKTYGSKTPINRDHHHELLGYSTPSRMNFTYSKDLKP